MIKHLIDSLKILKYLREKIHQRENNIQNDLAQTRERAEKVRLEIVHLISTLDPEPWKHCQHCADRKRYLTDFNLGPDRAVALCPPCYTILENNFTDAVFIEPKTPS